MCIVSTFKPFYWFWVAFMIVIMSRYICLPDIKLRWYSYDICCFKELFLSFFIFIFHIYISNLMFNTSLSRITIWFVKKKNTFCFCFVYLFDYNIRRHQGPMIWKVKHVTKIHSNFNFANTFWYCQYLDESA